MALKPINGQGSVDLTSQGLISSPPQSLILRMMSIYCLIRDKIKDFKMKKRKKKEILPKENNLFT